MPRTMSPKEFAAELSRRGIEKSAITVQKWCVTGVIKATKVGGRWHIKEVEIRKLLGE